MKTIQFLGTTDSEFLQRFKDEIIPELREQLSKEFQPKEPTEYLTRDEVCDLLKIDKSTLWRYTKGKKIPCYGMGGNRVYFKRSEIDLIINQNKLN
ncbi:MULTISPECIES: helix-turn-helix domain-containing protein [Chryseobacterium]|uniref:Excisionase family DNA binding protein n=1 Tax=Chryseobacterium geocarposphaerae TaxID=1416776 RepID=A0ABU1LCX4_9FLAO|nr:MULTISPECIES: helix-turn-helix domain-containing protein [Chryseobacterium]MDR6404576.1 excisionase family DNA binding protein [Chryseobacterium geocarposphaerae]MDR6698192.1 excisionase family DNA binding protein [Chryseobacterium ginsenosidimutans]